MNYSDVYIISNPERNRVITDQLQKLLIKAKSGQEDAFEELYNLYFEKIYRFTYYRVSHKEVAEDITEEVFIKAFHSLTSIQQDSSFEGWLYQIARNKVIDYYRSKKLTVPLDEVENILEYENTIVDTLSLESDQKIFLTVLQQLPSEQQIVIKLKFLEHLDNATIAQIVNKQEGAIRVLQHRAISKLKQLIEEYIKNKTL